MVKANALAEIAGNEVFILVTDHNEEKEKGLLSENVHLVDLDINYYRDDWKSRWHVLKGIFVRRWEHRKRLTTALNRIKPDVVISVGQCEQHFLPFIKGDFRTIREFHFAGNYRKQHATSLFNHILAFGGNILERITVNRYERIVVLTKEDKDTNWKGNKKVMVISNPLTIAQDSETSALTATRIITIGRLVHPKNYCSLIRAYRQVAQKHPDWKLDIYGDGCKRQELQQQIEKLHLTDCIALKGATRNVREVMLQSSIFVLSSLCEGFPLVLVEAMSCGLPVVSYACPCGPKDIITDGKDGILVPLNNEELLAEAICRLIEYPEERTSMGKAAKGKSEKYRLEKIIPKWMNLFNEIIKQKA